MQAAVGHAEVVLGLAEVELAHRRTQPRGPGRAIEQHSELLADICVFDAGAGDHVADTLPDLVETIEASPATALDQRPSSSLGGGPSTSVVMG